MQAEVILNDQELGHIQRVVTLTSTQPGVWEGSAQTAIGVLTIGLSIPALVGETPQETAALTAAAAAGMTASAVAETTAPSHVDYQGWHEKGEQAAEMASDPQRLAETDQTLGQTPPAVDVVESLAGQPATEPRVASEQASSESVSDQASEPETAPEPSEPQE